MKLRDVVLVIHITCLHGLTLPKFHETLSPADQIHYFGKEIKHDVPTYEFTSPQRVARQTDGQIGDDAGTDDTLEYLINAFGEQITLNLKKNTDLIAPGCVLETSRGDGSLETVPCHKQGEEDCVYTGKTNHGSDTWVAATTCNGLHGLIGLRDNTFLIQPIKKRHMSRVRRETTLENPHVIYHYRANNRSRDWKVEPITNDIPADLRQRRDGEPRKYIETAVVADKSLCDFHGDDTMPFIKTVLNIAAHLLLDHGLGTKLYMTVTRIEIMDKQDKFPVDRDAVKALHNLCSWKQSWNPRSDSHPHHVDYVMLLTRMDLSKDNNNDTTGLSYQTMCGATYSGCSVNQDYGLGMGLTVAHEAGHNLGMQHDGVNNSCNPGSNIMASWSASGPGAFTWSSCSDEYLDTFLSNTTMSKCLDDRPAERDIKFQPEDDLTKMPGHRYSADQQCKFTVGRLAKICSGYLTPNQTDVCSALVCKKDPHSSCISFGTPRMDGTDCHDNEDTPVRSWCIQGKCQPIEDPDVPEAVNGGWSDWEPVYGACSRTCGGGVKIISRRYCIKPAPMFGGSDCEGSDVKAQLCNLQICEDDQTCSPLTTNCAGKVDGSRCSTPATTTAAFSRCVDGKCMAFGCDGNSDSSLVFNTCLLCEDSDYTCKKIQHEYTGDHTKAWSKFTTFPVHASGIFIRQGSNSWHLNSKFVKGSSYLWNSMTKGECAVDGITVKYQPLDYANNIAEKLEMTGALQRSVQVELNRLKSGSDAKVYVEYYVPVKPENTRYTWQKSSTCGNGTQIPTITTSCVDEAHRTVEDSHCYIYTKPSENPSPDKVDECPGQWITSSWSACHNNDSCGYGVRTRRVTCSKSKCDNETKPTSEDHRCFVGPCDDYMCIKGSACNDMSTPSGNCFKDWSLKPEDCLKKRVVWTHCHKSCGVCVDNPIEYDPDCMYEDADNCNKQPEAFCNNPATNVRCKKLCKHCQDAFTLDPDCQDARKDCAKYGSSMCNKTNKNFGWAEDNCKKFCKLCLSCY